MASRKSSHKMKSAITDERKKRLLRVHRRSLDQREMRQEGVNRRRQIDDMSPVVESQEASKNPSTTGTPVTQNAGLSRLEMLKKWKEERELKRKLEAMERAKSKPGFKVKHVEYKDVDLYQKMKNAAVPTKQPVNIRQAPARAATSKTRAGTVLPPAASAAKTTTAKSNAKPTATKGVPATTTTKRTAVAAPEPSKKPVIPLVIRTTRNRGAAPVKTVAPVALKKVKQSPPKRAGKPSFMAPTAASQTRAAAKKEAAPPAATTTQKKRGAAAKAPAVKNTGKVTARRGDTSPPAQLSFAPSDFVFEAPSNVASFIFKPLSPASSASFLYPQGSANSTTMHTFTERVGRTSTPMCDGKPPASTEDDISDGAPNKTGIEEQTEGHSARASRSKVRRSRTTPADGSPILENKLAANKTSSSVVADSGVEVNAAGMDTADVKTLSQESSADTATSAEEEAFTNEQKSSSPIKNRKGRKSRQSVSRKRKAEDLSEQENETAAEETEKPVAERNEDSSQTQPKKGKRKSKRVSIQAEQADPEDSKEQASAAKQRRKSRKSTTSSKLEVVSELENMQESIAEASLSAQFLLSEKTTEEQATPSKSNRSRRSTAAKSKEMVQETEAGERTEEPEQKPTSRKSRRSNLPDSGDNKVSKRSDDEAMEITVEDNGEQGDVRTSKRARRSRRSVVAKQQEDSAENQESVALENKPATKSVTLVEPVETEMIPEPTTPENQRRKLRDRHAKDDLFLTPGPPVSSQKRSTAKRRRTATMIALSSAKSPEEAIKIIATSPMIEMTRRTPKAKISPELRNQSAALMFDENDFALAPVQLSSAFDAVSSEATTSDDNANSTEAEATHDTQSESAVGSSEKQEIASGSSADGEKETRDVTTFREHLSSETEKLTQLSSHWTDIAETTKDLPEEAQGQIRTTVCQAQLLMDSHKKSKFNRFAGLVDRCEAGDPATTCQDLEGFWDLVYIEVKNIYNEFEKLEHLQQNNWQLDLPAVQASSQPAKKTKKAATTGSKKQKPAGKSKFAAFKAQLMKQRQEENANTGGDAPEEKVFDAGFFKVNSPVRTPTYHCEAGTPSKSQEKNSTPATSKTSKEPTPATTASTTATDTPKKADNKENVAHVLLRRSVGGTPGRRSYVPTVPSPLLKDGVSAVRSPPLSPSKAANSANRASEEGGAEVEEKPVVHTTPVRPRKSLTNRRSTRGRKSVSFLERSRGDGEEEDDRVDLIAYLEPSNSQSNSPTQERVIEDSPFSVEDVLKHSQSDTPASATPVVPQSSGRREKNCLKSLPTSERRKSRRSVSFATSTNTSEGTSALPSTPYNINSLVPGRRVTRRSMASPGQGEPSPLGELKELCATTPPLRRSARPSLLYTPPKVESNRPKTPSKDVPVAKLISFSPSE